MPKPAKSARSYPTEVRHNVQSGVSAPVLARWAARWRSELRTQPGMLSIAMVSPVTMRKLNRQWRNKDHPTNVLSFRLAADQNGAESVWGEIILCPRLIRSEASSYDRSYRQHLLDLLRHGVMHISGFNHRTSKQQAAWDRRERQLRQVP